MRIAVLGVGLIGGSVGLAAKRRLGAEVAGFDPDPAAAERALELGALDRGDDSVAEAVAAPRWSSARRRSGALPALVAEALWAQRRATRWSPTSARPRGRWWRRSRGPRGERFIGGHPLAGAETAGVENARADLFEGARWYLTPTERSSGLLYDRLQRAIADLGARPQAIDAETHDRLMATVSHLPHVIANVLVQQAAAAAAEESERLPEVGPSFRDTTRVAGANPAIWGDIFATNREAVAREVDAVSERLREAAELIRAGDAERVGAWHGAAREDRRRLLEADRAGGELYELRLGRREPARHRRRDRAGARPRRRQHRGHGALPGARHAHAARSRSGSPARPRPSARPRSCASSATRIVSGRRGDAVRPVRAAARHPAAAARQVDQPPRRADRRRWGRGRRRSRAISTPPTRGRRWTRFRRSARRSRSRSVERGRWHRSAGARGRAARPGGAIRRRRRAGRDRRRERGHPASHPSRLARGAGQPALGRWTATSRSAAAPWTGSPSRCG